MLVLYLHGYGSTGEGSKSQAFKNAFGNDHVSAPDLPINPIEVEKIINNIVRKNKDYPLIFVGTSLGGFWANYFSTKWDAPCILVNPATRPSISLRKYLGRSIGKYTGKELNVTEEDLLEYAKREEYLKANPNDNNISMFIANDDSVISPEETLKNLPNSSYLNVKDTGGHRFEEDWGDVVERVKEILKG